jgi:hypothetical protein
MIAFAAALRLQAQAAERASGFSVKPRWDL